MTGARVDTPPKRPDPSVPKPLAACPPPKVASMTPPTRARSSAKTGANRRPDARLEIMDTTLRDGEQTQGVSFPAEEKLLLAQQLLAKVRVDRLEVASCRVSEGEQRSLAAIMRWAAGKGWENRIEVLSFTDHKESVDWLTKAGCSRMNLLTKGSLNHLTKQLRKTPAEHRDDIQRTLEYAVRKGVSTSIYLEDWSNGMLHSPDFVWEMLDHYKDWGFERILLPDTLGILNPTQVARFVGETLERYPSLVFEFHAHNDYGLATANCLVAAELGVAGLHCTVNGLGERAGNAPLEEVVATLRDHTSRRLSVREAELNEASRLVELFSGKRVSDNKAIVGRNVYTQTAGIHADGDKKGDLYLSKLAPARFGRDREYALGKLAGRSNLDFNLDGLNLSLTREQRAAVLARVVELGDRKHVVTADDLPFIVADVLQQPQERAFHVVNCVVTTAYGLLPSANICVSYRGETFEAQGTGSGGFDAFINALRSIAERAGFSVPPLVDYEVHIPPGGKTDALVETTITWEGGFRSRAVHSDQVMAAIQATERLINLIEAGILSPGQKKHRAVAAKMAAAEKIAASRAAKAG
jgi:D-citramalate synthase